MIMATNRIPDLFDAANYQTASDTVQTVPEPVPGNHVVSYSVRFFNEDMTMAEGKGDIVRTDTGFGINLDMDIAETCHQHREELGKIASEEIQQLFNSFEDFRDSGLHCPSLGAFILRVERI